MKIVVMWEDPGEEEAARNLTEVLPRIAPSLVNAAIDANGSVSVRIGASKTPLRVRARCCPAVDEAFRDAAERTTKAIAAQASIPGLDASRIVAYVGGKDYRSCPVCGVMKYVGAQCQNCEGWTDKGAILESLRAEPKAVEPERKPPKETRDLIFPEDD